MYSWILAIMAWKPYETMETWGALLIQGYNSISRKQPAESSFDWILLFFCPWFIPLQLWRFSDRPQFSGQTLLILVLRYDYETTTDGFMHTDTFHHAQYVHTKNLNVFVIAQSLSLCLFYEVKPEYFLPLTNRETHPHSIPTLLTMVFRGGCHKCKLQFLGYPPWG